MTTDELADDLTQQFAERLRAAAPTLSNGQVEDLVKQFREALATIAVSTLEEERERIRPSRGWS